MFEDTKREPSCLGFGEAIELQDAAPRRRLPLARRALSRLGRVAKKIGALVPRGKGNRSRGALHRAPGGFPPIGSRMTRRVRPGPGRSMPLQKNLRRIPRGRG